MTTYIISYLLVGAVAAAFNSYCGSHRLGLESGFYGKAFAGWLLWPAVSLYFIAHAILVKVSNTIEERQERTK